MSDIRYVGPRSQGAYRNSGPFRYISRNQSQIYPMDQIYREGRSRSFRPDLDHFGPIRPGQNRGRLNFGQFRHQWNYGPTNHGHGQVRFRALSPSGEHYRQVSLGMNRGTPNFFNNRCRPCQCRHGNHSRGRENFNGIRQSSSSAQSNGQSTDEIQKDNIILVFVKMNLNDEIEVNSVHTEGSVLQKNEVNDHKKA